MSVKANIRVVLDCSWRRVEPDAQTCLVCGETAWLAPLELHMGVEGQPMRPTGMHVCGSCGTEGDFKA